MGRIDSWLLTGSANNEPNLRSMKRIDILPRDDATNGWFETLPERSSMPALAGEVRTDWIVIGAGLARSRGRAACG